MSSLEFGWESLLRSDAPAGCALKAGLFTTYDRADERLLAEHLLPLLLKLNREPDGEGTERQYFLLELDERLKQLHDKLVVVSSTVREEPSDGEESESAAYGWIWRSIRQLTVGKNRTAMQHAKLWLLHWGAPGDGGAEHLEVVVSSANLTRSAFRGQLQAAWRACIELYPEGSTARLNGWGILPDFLRALAESVGDSAHFDSFVELLSRAECPAGVTFVGSVPGVHTRQSLRGTPWGVACLERIAPLGRGNVSISVLSPFVGSWKKDALTRWCSAVGGSPQRLSLVWIDNNHPWAQSGRWILPANTLKTLTGANCTLLHLRHEPDDTKETDVFHSEHRHADDRWSHAKVYCFRRGTSHRLLVTSANFSMAAWGSWTGEGDLRIENFELGVCIEQALWRLDHLAPFEDPNDAAVVVTPYSRRPFFISWARASWNGKNVAVECRCEGNRVPDGQIQVGSDWITISHWSLATDNLRSARVACTDSKRPPSLVELRFEQEVLRVAVFDERCWPERKTSAPPEVDEATVETMRDELLFEQYGGRSATDMADDTAIESNEAPEADPDGADIEEANGKADSYAVPAFVLARRHLSVVDTWADRVARVGKPGEFERQMLQRDGEMLVAAFERQAIRDAKKEPARAIGARLAAEELTLRLKHFPEA